MFGIEISTVEPILGFASSIESMRSVDLSLRAGWNSRYEWY